MSCCAFDSAENVENTGAFKENDSFQFYFRPNSSFSSTDGIGITPGPGSSKEGRAAAVRMTLGSDESIAKPEPLNFSFTLSQSLPFVRSSKAVKRNPESETVDNLHSTSRSHQPTTSGSSSWRNSQSSGHESLVDSLLGGPRIVDAPIDQSEMHVCSDVVSRSNKQQHPQGCSQARPRVKKEYLPTPRQLCQRSGRKKRVLQEAKQIATIQEHLLDLRRKVHQQSHSIHSSEIDLKRLKQEPLCMPSKDNIQVVPGSMSPSEWTLFNNSADHLYTPHSMQPVKRRHSASAEQPVLWDHEIPAWVPPSQRPVQQTPWQSPADEGSIYSTAETSSKVPQLTQAMYKQCPENVQEPPWTMAVLHSQQSHPSALQPQGTPWGNQAMRQVPRPWSMRHNSRVFPEE